MLSNERIYNFSAGPSMLPLPVLQQAQQELLNCNRSGMSVMEMSHRSSSFDSIFQETKGRLRRVLNVPESHEILFLQGGATTQFSMVPLNLMGETGRADYALTGNFSTKAYEEAQKFGACTVAASSADENHTYIPQQEALQLDPGAAYFHYCANNTIFGTEWQYVPDTGAVPLVCDMSSNILSKPIDVGRYGLIYAGAQKNMAPAGDHPPRPGRPRPEKHPRDAGLCRPRQGRLHVQHAPLLVHLYSGPGAAMAGIPGRIGRNGENQHRKGRHPVSLSG